MSDKIENFLLSVEPWQKENFDTFRALVHEVELHVGEDFKWSVPVFSVNKKLVCAMSAFKNHTKFNFFNGAALQDVHGLFNSGLDSKQHRSINLQQGQEINTEKLKDLLAAAFTYAKQ